MKFPGLFILESKNYFVKFVCIWKLLESSENVMKSKNKIYARPFICESMHAYGRRLHSTRFPTQNIISGGYA